MGKPSKDYAVPLWEKANLTVYEAAAYSGIGADKLRELSDREAALILFFFINLRRMLGTAQSGSSKGKSSMSFWKEPIQSNNQRCDSQNRIVVPNGGYRYPKAKRK